MFEISVSSVIEYLRGLLPPSQIEYAEGDLRKADGIRIKIMVSLRDGEESRKSILHFIFCGNTTVFFAEEEFGAESPPKPEDFKNTSNHDSCWRSDGVSTPLNQIYFRWAKEINDGIAPKDISQHASFLFGGHTLGKVLMRRTENDYGRARYKLVSFEPGEK